MTDNEKHRAVWMLQFGVSVYVELPGPVVGPDLGRRKLVRRNDGFYSAEEYNPPYTGAVMLCRTAEELVYAYEQWGARIVEGPTTMLESV